MTCAHRPRCLWPLVRLDMIACAATLVGVAGCRITSAVPPDLILDHVNVVDVQTGRAFADRTVAILNGRITSVAESPAGVARTGGRTRVIDLRGKYLIPGLWDMHVHIDTTERWFFPLAIAAGVTGVRDMGGTLARARTWKPEPPDADSSVRAPVRTGAVVPSDLADLRPLVVAAGPIVTGDVDDADPRVVRIRAADQAARVVDSLLNGGADFIKVHDWLSPEVYRALGAAAAARGSYLAGHLPIAVDPSEAAAAHQRSIEHLGDGWGLLSLHAAQTSALVDSLRQWATPARGPADLARHFTRAWYDRAAEAYDTTRATELARMLAGDSVWVTPTLYFTYWLQLAPLDSAVVTDPRLAYLPPDVRGTLSSMIPAQRLAHAARPDSGKPDPGARFFAVQQSLTRILSREGVGLLAGTDVGPYAPMIPGFSLHDELAQLVQAGLTAAEALRAATAGPALFLGAADSLGYVAPGRRADLVVLDANPLEDIRNVARIDAVIVGGRVISAADRQRMLDALSSRFAMARR